MSTRTVSVRRALAAAAAGVALTLLALTFDTDPLLVPGVAFALLGLAAAAWDELSAHAVRVERRLDRHRVVEHEPLAATVTVRRRWWAVPGAEVRDPLAPAPIPLPRPRALGQEAVAEVRLVTRFDRRGRRRLPAPTVRSTDPLGLAAVDRSAAIGEPEVLVLPGTEPVRWRGGSSAAERAGARRAVEPLAAVDIDGLRPYRPGTPASRIHWPAVARGAGLLERRLRQDGDARPLVVLDARGGTEEHLDAAVRAAASVVIHLARRGGCRVLLPGERRTTAVEGDLIAWPSVHARLALLEGGPGSRPPILAPGARMGPVFYVAARPPSPLPPLVLDSGAAAAILVVPRSLGANVGPRAALEVSGCTGFVIGARSRAGRGRAA